MVKSPMEYFQEQDFSLATEHAISPTEQIFLKKYLGIENGSLETLAPVEGRTVVRPAQPAGSDPKNAETKQEKPVAPVSSPLAAEPHPLEVQEQPQPAPIPAMQTMPFSRPASAPQPSLRPEPAPAMKTGEEFLKQQAEVTFVGYYVGEEIFVIPIDMVLEVIHYEEPYKLPMAPYFMPGVVNLRGRVLPVISLQALLTGNRQGVQAEPDKKLIIVCENKGMQVGLVIHKLHTMLKADQGQITWNVESHLGPNTELFTGLLETGEKLLGILSIERIVDKILGV